MSEFVEFVILGLGTAAIYSLLASGVVVIYRGSGVVNFAHGAFALVGALTYLELHESNVAPVLALVVASAIGMALGVVVQFGIMRRLRTAAPLARVIATLGLLIVIQAIAVLRYGDRGTIPIPQYLPQNSWDIFGISVQADRIILLLIAISICVTLTVLQSRLRIGLATRAAAEKEIAAATLGWSPNTLGMLSWALGGALAGLAGALIVPITGISIGTIVLLVVPALAAALIGRFDSFFGALAGALGIGIGQALLTRYVHQQGAAEGLPFLVLVVVLVVTGQSLPLRSYVSERLPSIGSGLIRPVPVAGVFAGVLLLMLFVFNTEWIEAFTVSFSVAVVMLSVVVLSGYAGQISLAQYAIAGLGAYVAGRLVATTGTPFWLAALLGIGAAVPIGSIFALPALRTRGVNLAVVTLGMGVAVSALLFANVEYTGSVSGTAVGKTELFGFDISAISHPDRYGIFALVLFTLAALLVANLRRSPAGRRMIAIRENERAATSLGISVSQTKMYAFAFASTLAALGGILIAFRGESIIYTTFDPLQSVYVVAFTVIGGVGYVLGPLLGSMFIAGGFGVLIENLISGIEEYLPLIGGVFVLVTLLLNPDGMVSGNAKFFQAVREKMKPRRVHRPGWVPSLPRRRRARTESWEIADEDTVRVQEMELAITDLTVRFGAVTAVNGVDLSVPAGKITGLIGPNGAGKTTLIDAVTGFVSPRSGSIRLGGRELSRTPAHRRARAGIVRSWQSLELFEDVSLGENMLVASESRNVKGRDWLRGLIVPGRRRLSPAAGAAIREFRLTDDLQNKPGELSYGRRRLAGIARAVALQPSVLLLDEPAAGLNTEESRELGRLLRRLADTWGIGILLVEHDVELVMSICDQIAVLNFGEKIASGSPDEVKADEKVIAAYLGGDEGEDGVGTEIALAELGNVTGGDDRG